jgi:sulfur-oxidizing protein SoxX
MKARSILGSFAAVALVVGCATQPASDDFDRMTDSVLKSSFRDQGPVKVDRLVRDESNRECDDAMVKGEPLGESRAKAIEAINMKTVAWPSDGKFLGDWKEGEKIAQNGRGLTWTDDAKVVNGGNCYNCHQITKEEISFGTIGPSLYNYAKQHGVTNPQAPEAKAMVEYTWGKIWNARAYNACSNMPRFGSAHIIDEKQVRHVMALLLDPQSPVNK